MHFPRFGSVGCKIRLMAWLDDVGWKCLHHVSFLRHWCCFCSCYHDCCVSFCEQNRDTEGCCSVFFLHEVVYCSLLETCVSFSSICLCLLKGCRKTLSSMLIQGHDLSYFCYQRWWSSRKKEGQRVFSYALLLLLSLTIRSTIIIIMVIIHPLHHHHEHNVCLLLL